MNEKELQEIEDVFEYSVKGQAHWHLDDKQILKLIDEVRRLNEWIGEIKPKHALLEKVCDDWEKLCEQLQKENELLRNTSPLMCTMHLEQENQRYKQALEEIVELLDNLRSSEIHDFPILVRGIIDRTLK
jgi:DNA repair exonuclease SbcCD ATPase subunit